MAATVDQDNDFLLAVLLSEQYQNEHVYNSDMLIALSMSYNTPYIDDIEYKSVIINGNITKVAKSNKLSVNRNELYIPCKKHSIFASVTLFPDDNDINFSLNDIDLQKRMDYMAREYHVYLKRVSTLDDAIKIVKQIKKSYSIGHLELGGHGNATSLAWPKHVLKVDCDTDKLRELFSLLHYDAAIMTLSCYNGKNTKKTNMLEFLAGLARGHKVIGTSCANSKRLKLKISSARPFIIEYTNGNKNVTVTKLVN